MLSRSYHEDTYPKRSLSQTSTTTSSSRSTQRSDEKKHHCKSSSLLTSKTFRSGSSNSPISIDTPQIQARQRAVTVSHARDIPRSVPQHSYFDQPQQSTSPVEMSPTPSSPSSPRSLKQEDFPIKRVSAPTRKNSDDYRRYSGTINHFGRHSNDWLFGGFSVRDTVRDSFEKFRHHDKGS
ncbi:hypothetical protein N7462_007504 [Penicillium macrosclerotiorum]|uniref:uncharacterized protein n=1 Tax=Penicillium macrosclerotiorum TaxID=303699 RepID=UPI00254828CE|nr:uncharacterized protein N7462_007504 [Penicillium macrosclerotiorum]KAJ5679260.1 hypothetical protein N7462_007504 [Penicillium macrosclerotiorum]